MALGAWLRPYVISEHAVSVEPATVVQPSAATDVPVSDARSEFPKLNVPKTSAKAAAVAAVPATAPSLHERLKPLLNRGADMGVAAAGFRDGEQFATLAHASKNTNVPFMVLKHRVLKERKTLSAAIQESDPHIDAGVEARRAVAEAKSDIAALKG
jgi:hypothetical protein